MPWNEYKIHLANDDVDYVPYDVHGEYGQLFNIIESRYADMNSYREFMLFLGFFLNANVQLAYFIDG